MATEAHITASVRHNQSKDSITIRPHKAEGTRIRQAAADAGQSVQAYILDALRVRLDADGVPNMEEKED